jgi:outer membrane receptor protein involved in Fe transport
LISSITRELVSAARSLIACVLIATFVSSSVLAASAQSTNGRVSGTVLDQTNGLPVTDANVGLFQGGASVRNTKTNSRGAFSIDSVAPGLYTLIVESPGYLTSQSREFVVTSGLETALNLAINRATESQTGNLKTIGTVTATSASAFASTTTITRTLNPDLLQKENNIRLADALVKLPGVDGQGLSSSPGDDTYINIRGLGASETQALLDGHPIGPVGVYGINGGGSYPSSFNYADTPIFGLSRVQVTFGSGASGLYGVDAIGGTVDMQTISPTLTPKFNFVIGAGSQGRNQSLFTFTGSLGKFQYALAAGANGTYGMDYPGIVAQTGRPNNNPNLNNNGACTAGNDISQCNLNLNTYSVSQNTIIKGGVAKVRYNLSNNTNFTATIYSSGSQADSTGNGDNDNIPYDTRLAQIQANQTPNCSLPGDAAGAMSGYQVIVDANGNTACDTAQQWAAASSGPYGGGADRNRGTNTTDYHFRLQSTSGIHTITADGFYNYYKYYKSSEEAGGLDPTGTMYAGTAYSQFVNSMGWLASDDMQFGDKGEAGYGYFGEYQADSRLNYNVTGQGLYNYSTPASAHYNSGFARGQYTFNPRFSAFAAFWVKNSSVDNQTSFDPRISFVLRPADSDIVRLTYGHSTGDPAAELKASGPPDLNGNPSSLNPSCTPYNVIGSGGNPNIKAEAGNDYEVGYAHKFAGDSSIQLNLYYTGVQNQLFSAAEPLTQFGSVAIPQALLQQYASKIASAGCPGVDPNNPESVIPYLAISTTYNAATAVSKGIELVGRQRFTRQFYIDYSYNYQSVVQNGINDAILMGNPFIINGGQVQGIPPNQANLGIDYSNRGFEARMDGYLVGTNNPKQRGSYNTWDGFISQTTPQGLTITLGVQNVFNQATQMYGYFGHQQFIPENHFYSDTNSIQQYVSTGSGEEYGTVTRSFLLSIGKRI